MDLNSTYKRNREILAKRYMDQKDYMALSVLLGITLDEAEHIGSPAHLAEVMAR